MNYKILGQSEPVSKKQCNGVNAPHLPWSGQGLYCSVNTTYASVDDSANKRSRKYKES